MTEKKVKVSKNSKSIPKVLKDDKKSKNREKEEEIEIKCYVFVLE